MKQRNEVPNKEQERQYIRETIVGRSKWYWCKRILLLFFIVILLSGAAGVTFALSKNWIETKREEEPTSSDANPEGTVQESEKQTEEETETIGEQQEESSMLEQQAYKEAQNSIVTISITKQSVDWFDTSLEQVKQTFGVIIDITEESVLILTNAQDISNGDSVVVTIGEQTIPVTVQGICLQDNIALITVDYQRVASLVDTMKPIKTGDSSQIKLGDRVILAGSPLGYTQSVLFGIITYIDQSTTVADGSYQMYYTSLNVPVNSSGFLLNTKGELIGWISESYKKTDLDGFAACIGMNDLNYVIEHMKKGRSIAMLGAEGLDVTDEIAEQIGLSSGFFLTGALDNSPAYTAGMQSGDVIVAIDEENVTNIKTLRTILNSYEAGESAEITVMRKGKDTYREIQFNIIFSER
ncbi:putative periplasmic serine endoprotease DegP-like precursor [Clostridiales bacterium CHKCI001]|nr:putative periplasmic serine endoprotease DegP-like precursor [Clostridiales bacterium CHKCI001]